MGPVTESQTPTIKDLKTLLEYYQNERYEDAEKLALIINKGFPKHKFSWKVLGAIFQITNRTSDALIANKKVVELDSKDHEAYNNLGVTLETLGKLEEAESSFKKAIALKPNYAEAHYNLGNALKELDRLEEAQANFERAIAITPNSVKAYNSLGNTLREIGKLKEAETCFDKVIEINPGYGLALMNRGRLLVEKEDFKAALNDFDLCDTEESRVSALSALNALGRVDEIYQRIEKQSELDGVNRRLAAFASFIAKKELRDTANNFCKNPLDFLYFSTISSHVENYNSFSTEIIKELVAIDKVWEPSGKTTKKGFQSKVNLFGNPSGKIAQLKTIILDELEKYYSKFKNEPCLYMQKWPSQRNLVGWYVILKQQGHQLAHIHPSGWLSGVIYLKVVPSLGKDEGAIEFGFNGETYSDIDLPTKVHQPELGDIVFFPSSLHHRTIPFTTDTDRIVVSFDFIPNQIIK